MNSRGNTTLARLVCDERTARRLADRLAESFDSVATAVAVFEGTGGRWNVEVHFEHPPDEAAVRALVAQAAGGEADLTFETIEPKDWVAASLADLKPVTAGRFTVHGAHDRTRVAPNRTGIEIEAALAFGTGHHGTTRGCLLALDAWVKRRKKKVVIPGRPERPDKRASILDIGTGTGVLAIAAARALRQPVLASDIDAAALRVARGNIRRNHCGALIETLAAAGVAARRIRARAPYDLVFANILLGPLTRMAAPMARLLAPGGVAILSGLLPSHANAVIAACRAQSLSLERRIVVDNWVTLVLPRRC